MTLRMTLFQQLTRQYMRVNNFKPQYKSIQGRIPVYPLPHLRHINMDQAHGLLALNEKDFATKVPTILWTEKDVFGEDGNDKIMLLRARAAEPSTVEAISSILTSPIKDEDFGTLKVHQIAFYSVLLELSFDQLQPYRPALAALAAFDISNFKSRSSHYAQTSNLIRNAGHLARFAADSEAVWVTEDKFDEVSYRTLSERVHTAEQMRPYMHDLFEWVVDANHPPFTPCRNQLARFPEAAAVVAAEVMCKANESKDEEQQHYLMDFVSDCVPVGEAWRPMREPVQALVEELEKREDSDEGTDDLLVEAREWLANLDDWEASRV